MFVLPLLLMAQMSDIIADSCGTELSEINYYSCMKTSTNGDRNGMADHSVEVVVELRDFEKEAEHLDFVDGHSVSYDATTFVVREPKAFSGKSFQVFHERPPGPESIWREVGSIHTIIVDSSVFNEKGKMLFSAAVRFVCQSND